MFLSALDLHEEKGKIRGTNYHRQSSRAYTSYAREDKFRRGACPVLSPEGKYLGPFLSISDSLCKHKPLPRFGDVQMEVTGLHSTPNAEQKDCVRQT